MATDNTRDVLLPEGTQLLPRFYELFLKNPNTAIPRGAQWLVSFDNLEQILSCSKQALKYEPNDWDISKASRILTEDLQRNAGCLFAQAVSLPGESFAPVAAGNISSNAFIKPYVGSGRDNFPIINMSFLETVTSFTDYILRPWVVATETYGMFAWPKGSAKDYRTNMTCWKLDSNTGQSGPIKAGSWKEGQSVGPVKAAPEGNAALPVPKISMAMTFYGICCVGVGDEEYNYMPATSPMLRSARFAYNNYTVHSTGLG
jgi:hypothetical protein